MKKALVLIVILSTLIISGCTQSKNFTIESKDFTESKRRKYIGDGIRAGRG